MSKPSYIELRELTKDAHVQACINSRKAGVTSTPYTLKSSDSKLVEELQNIFSRLDFPAFLANILDAPYYGFQAMEIIWGDAPPEGLGLVPASIEAKPHEWFLFDENGKIRLRSKLAPFTGEELPLFKFLCPIHRQNALQPAGEALFDSIFNAVNYKKGGAKFWASFVEKYGMPWALGSIPRQTLDSEAIKFKETLENMVQDGVAVYDEACSVELVESKSKDSSSAVYRDFITFQNEEISKAILGQTLTTQTQGSGSYALGRVHSQVRDDILRADIKLVENVVNTLIGYVLAVNGLEADVCFEFVGEILVDTERAARDKVLSDAGVQFSKSYFMRAYGLLESDFSAL